MGAKLFVEVVGDASSYERSLKSASSSTESFGKKVSGAAKLVSAAFIGGIAVAAKVGFDELKEANAIAAQTEAVLKSTAGVANVTADEIDSLASSLSKMSGVDDEAIKQGQNLLLTFTNVRNEAGRGNDVFNRATRTMLDFAVATGKDSTAAAKMLGKALNDPLKGMSGLAKAGVVLSDSQKAMVKKLVESGDTMGAQKILLGELEERYKGSAKAAGETLSGQINIAKNAFEEMAASMVEALLPAITAFAGTIAKASNFLAEHKTLTIAIVGVLGTLATGILAVNIATKVYQAGVAAAAAAQWLFNAAVSANPIGIIVLAIAGAVAALVVLEKKFGIVSAVVDALKGAFERVLGWLRGTWQTVSAIVTGPFTSLLGQVESLFGVRPKLEGAFRAVVGFVREHWPVIATLISGPFAPLVALATNAFGLRDALIGAFRFAKEAISTSIGAVIDKATSLKTLFEWIGSNAVKIWGRVAEALKAPISGLTVLFSGLEGVLSRIKSLILWILDKVAEVSAAVGKALGSLGGLLGAVPGMARGGPVSAGQAYVVGEKGPELFLPGSNGVIVPNSGVPAAASSSSVSGGAITIHVHGNVTTERDLLAAIRDGLNAEARRLGQAAWLAG